MNKFIAIGTALLIFFQSINLHFSDFVELDELVEHYQFHHEEYGDDFLVFMSKHYGQQKADHSQKHQEEKKDHEDLPFQHHTQCSQLQVFVVESKPLLSLRSDVPSSSLDNFHYYISYSEIWGENLLQPPKQA